MATSIRANVKEYKTVSNDSRWWKPISKTFFQKHTRSSYSQRDSGGSRWVFGVETDSVTGQILQHNYMFYYYVMTALLASIYIFILFVNLCGLIPIPFIPGLLVLVGAVVFGITFIGLIALMINVAIKSDNTIPPAPPENRSPILEIASIMLPLIVLCVTMSILPSFVSSPLILVGLLLAGIDMVMFCFWFGIKCSRSRAEAAVTLKKERQSTRFGGVQMN